MQLNRVHKSKNRASRVRNKLRNSSRPTLQVTFSNKHIHVQVMSADKAFTLASATTAKKGVVDGDKSHNNSEAAAIVGQAIAQSALDAGIKQVVFDRGSRQYHGRVKVLAEAARTAGLEF